MSVPNRRRKRVRLERSSLQLAEESFHLLRSVDLRYLWVFYLGVIPFAVGLLYFTADMSRSGLADESVVGASLVMTGLYFWMRICQARFCKGLWDTIAPAAQDPLPRTERIRQGIAACFFQSLQTPLLLVGLFFVIPLGWIIAALQNASVLAFTQGGEGKTLRRLFGNSFRHSHFDWAQNHGVLLIFAVVGLFTWINLVATAIVVPTLVKAFFGVESVFTISPTAAILNSTFFLGTLILTYLVMSPMLKAAYTLRCFYAESRTTGADLLSRLASCEKTREPVSAPKSEGLAKASAVVLAILLLGQFAGAQEPPAPQASSVEEVPAAEVTGDDFQDEIARTLEQKKYQWQLSQREMDSIEESEQSWLSRWMRDIADSTRDAMKSFSEWIKEQWRKMSRDRQPVVKGDGGDGLDFSEGLSSTFSIALIVIVSALVAWLLFVMYRKYRGKPPIEAEEVAIETVDLQSEDIVASQLPENEWMKLAREQMEKGDRRLAIRALFLASLAHLGEVGLLKIARFKSNRDYRFELIRRARKQDSLRLAFDRNTHLFERAWYGWHPVSEANVEEFLKNHQAIAEESRNVPGARSSDLPLPKPNPA